MTFVNCIIEYTLLNLQTIQNILEEHEKIEALSYQEGWINVQSPRFR